MAGQNKFAGASAAALAVMVLGGMALHGCSGDSGGNSTASTSDNSVQASDSAPPAAPAPSPADAMKQDRPADEMAFINAVNEGKDAFKKADNDMAKGGTRAARKSAICAALPHLSFDGWTGKITQLSSNSEGKGVLAIDIDDGITLVTWNNALSDSSDNTLIDPTSPLFKMVSDLKEGDMVKFSGTMFSDDEDCVHENSLFSVEESMTNPHFITRFTTASTL